MKEESKQEPTDAQNNEAFLAELQQKKEANKSKHPEGWKYEPSNVPLTNQKEIWESIKSELKKMIEETDLEIAKQEETKVEERKGQDSLNVETFLLIKIDQIKQSVSRNVKKQRPSPFNPWNLYFSSSTSIPIEELNVNLGKLIALTSSQGPEYQSLVRATKFFEDVEEGLKNIIDIPNQKNESKKKKKPEEIPPQPEEYFKQIQINVRAMNNNLETYNGKVNEKLESQKAVINAIKMQFGLQKSLSQIEELSSEEEKFLKKIEESKTETIVTKKNLTPYKFDINDRYKKILDQCCVQDDEIIIRMQVLKSKSQSGFYFGEIKTVGSVTVANKEQNSNFIKKLFEKKESPLHSDEQLIQNGKYMMHGRGMYFDKKSGKLYEGWFEDNKLIEGRCIYNDEYYVGYFNTTEDGKFIKEGSGTCYYSNGKKVTATWQNDKQHGKGEVSFGNAMKCECEFKEGVALARKFTQGKVEHIAEQPVNIENEQELNQIHSIMVSKSKNAPK